MASSTEPVNRERIRAVKQTPWRVTLHDHRSGADVETIEHAEWIGAASDPVWAAIPASERHHYCVSIESMPAGLTKIVEPSESGV